MRKQNDHSEEYKKGYRVGYNAGYAKGKRNPKANLFDLTALVRWEQIDGDEETFHCPRCGENFYSEDKKAPNFCWNCGAQSLDMKKAGERNEKIHH